MPETADTAAIKAKQSNGVLEVTIPKQPQVQPQRISRRSCLNPSCGIARSGHCPLLLFFKSRRGADPRRIDPCDTQLHHDRFAIWAAAALALAGAVANAVAALPAALADSQTLSLAPMIKRVSPAVVNIATRGTVNESGPQGQNPTL